MRITEAFVVDRRGPTSRRSKRPIIAISIDEMPVPTNEIERRTVSDVTYTTAKYGPLIEFAVDTDGYLGLAPSGEYNVIFRDGFAPVVDVIVFYQGQAIEGNWCLPLRRARALLKKYEPSWRLALSDYDAVNGTVSWTPTQISPKCCAQHLLGESCNAINNTVAKLTIRGIDYTLCAHHKAVLSAKNFERRTESRQ